MRKGADMELVLIGLSILAVAGVAGMWAAISGMRRGVEARLAQSDGELRRLADSGTWRDRGADEIRREVSAFRQALGQLGVREEERRAREEEGWAVLHRVAAVLSGGQRTGRAGENVLREALSQLPPSMVATDFRVNGLVVEFALILPDGRRLPVDSKWSADGELQALARAEDPAERDRLIQLIERTVARRAREVAGYRDPSLTTPVAVAAVPDAAYAVLRRAHAQAYRHGVIVVPYSMALPVALFLHGLAGRTAATGDIEACLVELAGLLDGVEATLENKIERAGTMLGNGAQELRGQVGRARASLARASVPRAPSPDRDRAVGQDRDDLDGPRLARVGG